MGNRFVGIHIEEGAAGGLPVPVMEEEYGRGCFWMSNRGHAFHVAPLDCLELYSDSDEGSDVSGLFVTHEFDAGFPLAFLPAQATRLAAGRSDLCELRLEPFALEPK